MIDPADKYLETFGAFPNVTGKDTTGAGQTDGTAFIKAGLDDWELGFGQAMMNYAAGGVNAPIGLVGVPNGISESAGASQYLQAIQQAHAIGPGTYKFWGGVDDPSVTGDRLILLSGQGILIASYPDLVAKVYVGDGNNATAPFFYKAVAADGLVRYTGGDYLILPQGVELFRKTYIAGVDFTITGGFGGFVLISGRGTPWKDPDENWFLDFHAYWETSFTSDDFLSVSGVTFVANEPFTLADRVTSTWGEAFTNSSNGIIIKKDVASGWPMISGTVALASKPTWAKDFSYPLGITY